MRFFLLIALIALPALAQYENEQLGPLKVGLAEPAITQALGPPSKRGKLVLEAATGLTVSEWHYPKLGLLVTVSREKPQDAWRVERLVAHSPCKLRTSKGVGLGDTLDRIRVAYTLAGEDKPSDSVVLGDGTGIVLVFKLAKGRIGEIYLGPGPE